MTDSEFYEYLAREVQEQYINEAFQYSNKDFEILSTIRYDPKLTHKDPITISDISKDNFFLFDEHYQRLLFTIKYFFISINGTPELGFEVPYDFLLQKLIDAIETSGESIYKPLKIRLLVSLEGNVKVEVHPTQLRDNLLDGLDDLVQGEKWDVYMDSQPSLVSPFTSFKTTKRDAYNNARNRSLPGRHSGREEVLLINTQGHLMEGSITNVAVRSKNDGKWVTPQLSCGCLCGVMRHFLLKKDYIQERTIQAVEISQGSEILLFNGIMGVVKGVLR